MHWRSILLFCGIILFAPCSALAADPPGPAGIDSSGGYPGYVDELAQYRVSRLDIPFPTRFNSTVEGYIRGYVERNREKSAVILGRTILYFSRFEELLKEHGLPEELKYLAVVESALNPEAVSPAGAVGLWQFIPETGTYYGLRIDAFRDERRDPEQSTIAAIQYLKRLYERFDDWALAIAAYNSGPGRVSRAIRLARSTDFWRLRRYLPRETRSYVPAFIGAAYLIKHYKDHQLKPELPPLDLQLTEEVRIHRPLAFFTIAQVTGLALDVIRALNPAYVKEYIPASDKGLLLRLPKRVMTAMTDYLQLPRLQEEQQKWLEEQSVLVNTPSFFRESDHYYESIYTVGKNDRLRDLAAFFNCPVHCLMAWNGLQQEALLPGQELVLYQPRELRRFALSPEEQQLGRVPLPELREVRSLKEGYPWVGNGMAVKRFFWYTLGRQESIYDVAQRFPGNSLKGLLDLNGLDFDTLPSRGERIKVRGY